jgi:hypothetical protein
MGKFKKGDRVKRVWSHSNIEERGVILDIREMNYFSGPEEYYDIVWDNGIREMKMASVADSQMNNENTPNQIHFNIEKLNPNGGYNAITSSDVKEDFESAPESDWLPFNIEPPDPSLNKFWNPRYFRIKLLEDDTENTKECNHRWKTYVGFTEQYEYCEICDARRK